MELSQFCGACVVASAFVCICASPARGARFSQQQFANTAYKLIQKSKRSSANGR